VIRVVVVIASLIAFGFALGFLVGTEYVDQSPDLNRCQAVSERLSEVFSLSRDREVVKLDNGLWCRLK